MNQFSLKSFLKIWLAFVFKMYVLVYFCFSNTPSLTSLLPRSPFLRFLSTMLLQNACLLTPQRMCLRFPD